MDKIKGWEGNPKIKNIFVVLIIVFVGAGSFGLGRLSKHPRSEGIRIEYPPVSMSDTDSPAAEIESGQVMGAAAVASASPVSAPTSATKPATSRSAAKSYFASSRGRVYYHLGCSGGKTLKEENKIFFATEQEAINAGYSKSTSCK